MLTELRLQNFKSWSDTGPLRLAPLTVFFGTNSSGKSSLSQFLLMLKQTAQSPDRQRVLHPGDHRTIVDLGSFEDLLHCKTARQKQGLARIEFDLSWTLRDKMDVQDSSSGKIYSGEHMRFSASIGKSKRPNRPIVVQSMAYQLGDIEAKGLILGMERTGEKDNYDLVAAGFKPKKTQGKKKPLDHPVHFYGFPTEVTAYYKNLDFVRDLQLELEECLLHELHYLGPLRAFPQRFYTWSGEYPEHVGTRGDRAVDAILAAQGRKISAGPSKHPTPFKEIIARWLKEMGLIERFKVAAIGKTRKDYEVLVKTRSLKEGVNLTDVGFGVSQVLPVIVECFYASAHSTIIIEQPEVHLHPSVQVSLADLFIETIRAREVTQPTQENKDRNIQLIVESHSEHFLRRLQRRIAEGTLKSSETALYFCSAKSEGSVIEPLKVDDYGNITNWPRDFFGDQMTDIVEMQMQGIRRRRQDSEKA